MSSGVADDTEPASPGLGPTVPSGDEATAPGDMPELARGAVISRYVILSRVGAGGMGVIYAAYDPELDRKVALKVLRQLRGVSKDGQKRLLREAQALAKLQHPNVVAVHDAGAWNDRIWIAMEFVRGQTLSAWLAEAPRDRHRVLSAMTEVARGLSAAHRLGLVHRDVKPDNIMISTDGRLRVMDFGLVCADDHVERSEPLRDSRLLPPDYPVLEPFREHLTEDGAVIGTPAYMSPEQCSGSSTDGRTDQFSWCVTTWEAIFGARPFHGETAFALAKAIARGKPRPPAGRRAPRWLRRVLERGLSHNQDRRFASMNDLLLALERGVRRRAAWQTALAVMVSAALLGAVWQLWSWRQAQFQRLRVAVESAQVELRHASDFLATATRVGANEPRLKAVLGTDPETIQDVVHELAHTLGQDAMVLCDSENRSYVSGDARLLSLCELRAFGAPDVRGVRTTPDHIYLYACTEILLGEQRLGHVCLVSDALQVGPIHALSVGLVTTDNTVYPAQLELRPRRPVHGELAEVIEQLEVLAPEQRLEWLLGDAQKVGIDEIRVLAWEYR